MTVEKTESAKGNSSRRRGHDFERQVVKALRDAMPNEEVERGYQYTSGWGRPDVRAGAWHIECKTGKAPSLTGAYRQALRDTEGGGLIPVAGGGLIPVAVAKRTRELPVVVVDQRHCDHRRIRLPAGDGWHRLDVRGRKVNLRSHFVRAEKYTDRTRLHPIVYVSCDTVGDVVLLRLADFLRYLGGPRDQPKV